MLVAPQGSTTITRWAWGALTCVLAMDTLSAIVARKGAIELKDFDRAYDRSG
jgi:hypothetical protein